MNLFLRLYANCDDEVEARRLSGKIDLALSAWKSSPATLPRRYWKMAELYEFAVNLYPATMESFDAVCALAAANWQHDEQASDRSSVWKRADDLTFLTPEVKWVELQLYESGP